MDMIALENMILLFNY